MSEAPDFVHLRTRTHYSLLTATADVGDMVAAAAADGQKALALTDNGNLFGAVEFYKACKEKGLRSVLGLTAYVAGKSMREPTSAENPSHDLTLLAATQEGWDNLRLLSSRSWLEGFSYRPRIDLDLLAKHGKGLIVLSGSTAGEVASAILKNDGRGAMAAAARLRDIVGQDNFFLEVAETGYEPQRRATSGLKRIGQELGIPCVATNDVHYLKPEHWLAQDIALCIRNGRSVADQDRQRMGSRELYLRTRAEMARAFSGWEDVLHQTVAIADRCSVKLEFGVYHVPVFQPDTGESPDDHFARRCREGAIMRYGQLTEEVTKRLEYEIGVVRKLGFVSYFLIVQDFILKAKSMGIPVGPGRGSAAGSIVAYALEITDVDPLRYNLLFERFLNPGRVSMPDIDIDFCGNRRDEVIRYVREKYGNDCVCQIITFGTMASRGVLRDVGRVLDMDLGEVDKLCKKVPQGPGASLKAALESDPELKQLRESSQQHKRLFDLSLNLEGLARHSSIHAAGVVIADKPLVEYVPLSKNGEDVTTQWQMTELEEVGLLKMDFLGLKTLTILQEAVRLVKEVHGVDIDLGKLPLDDAPTYAIMTRGETQGIFQLESSGMRELLTRLKPDTFEDVIAVLALYRPGPLGSGMVDMFVRRKHGQEEVVYEHESLRPLLEATYGVIVYQEQVMQIANVVGAFSMADADNLRKAMGKKKPEVMAKFKEQFVQGAKGLGYDEKFARQLFETMEYFAGYGFNKSHSTAYALLTYQTAWLKAHYPLEFTAANMTVESGNSDKIKEFVDDTRRSGIRLLPPHVNHSASYFRVESGAIRYGLGAVKGIGTRAAALLAEERDKSGAYDSLENLCERLDSTLLNKTALEALAMAGAFDGMGRSRKATMDAIESAMRSSAVAREDRRRGQKLLFAAASPAGGGATAVAAERSAAGAEWNDRELLANEKAALGFYLSGHPFEKRGGFLRRIAGTSTGMLKDMAPGSTLRIAGMISSVRVLQIKQGKNAGQKMARFLLEDLEGSVPVTVFARTYALVKDRIVDDAIVFLEGKIDANSEEKALLCSQLEPANETVRREVAGIVLHLEGMLTTPAVLDRIFAIVEKHRGNQQLHLDILEDGQLTRVRTEAGIRVTDDLLDDLAVVVGPANMSFSRL